MFLKRACAKTICATYSSAIEKDYDAILYAQQKTKTFLDESSEQARNRTSCSMFIRRKTPQKHSGLRAQDVFAPFFLILYLSVMKEKE